MLGLETSLCSFGPTDAHPEQIKTVTNEIPNLLISLMSVSKRGSAESG
jgi:hypothetical protein